MELAKLEFKADKTPTEEDVLLALFQDFLKVLPTQLLINDRLVNWHLIRLSMSFYRYDASQTKIIVRQWIKMGLVKKVSFRGIRVLRGVKNG